jgi:hypothetical protein
MPGTACLPATASCLRGTACLPGNACRSCLLAAAAGLLQIREIIGKYPNQRPFSIGVRIGHSDSLARQLQGSSSRATHLRLAADDRGQLTAGGILNLAVLGSAAMQTVRAADRVDVAMALAVIGDDTNRIMLAERKLYLQRHEQQLRIGSHDDGCALLVQALLGPCKRLRELRAAGCGAWYGHPNWKSTGGSSGSSGRIRLNSISYRCDTVPDSLITVQGNESRGFSAEQLDQWHRQWAAQTALEGAQAAKPGGKPPKQCSNSERPPKQCTNSWCERKIAYAGFARHVRECKAMHAKGGELGASHRMTVTQRKEQDARGRSLGY